MLLLSAMPRRSSPFFLLALAALAAASFASSADARPNRYNYDYDYDYEYGDNRRPQRAAVDPEPEAEPFKLDRPAGPPRLAVVSLGDQRVTIYDANGQIMQGPISSGATPNDTPPGIYAILQKNREHYSNRYDDARMPFMQRITWTGMALHGGVLPGYPASHGCVRLNENFASKLFDMTQLGMRVIVSRNNMAPADISHPLLFKPSPFRDNVAVLSTAAAAVASEIEDGKSTRYVGGGQNDPPELATRTAALQSMATAKTAEAQELNKKVEEARVAFKQKQTASARVTKALKGAERAYMNAVEWQAGAEKNLSRAKTEKQTKRAEEQKTKAIAKVAETKAKFEAVTAENKPALDELARAEEAFKAIEAEHKALAEAARDAQRKMSPVSVFISRSTNKLYIRQALEQIYEGDVIIRDPEAPIGTHIFTAVDYQPGGRDMKWNVVSIAGRQQGEPEKSSGMNKHPRNASVPGIPTDAASASAALDRIEIPRETAQRISELVLPGSSLIVSDEAAHKETAKATDFIVLLSGEPQGGIILRPKPRDEYYDDYWGYGGYGYNDGYDRRRRRGGAPYGPFGGAFKWW
jgi:lipoprotein-anchoring transpeptidase ErfK/SrfK